MNTENARLRAMELDMLARGLVPARYERNIGTLGLAGQQKLLGVRVAIIGLGGLGGYVAETLARLGVGQMVGVDGDVFSESNLNRQLLSDVHNLGQAKAAQARLRVGRVNPAVEFTPHSCRFEELDEQAFGGCAAVFDCLDTIPARLALADRCAAADVVLVHGAIAGWCGQVGVCPPGGDLLKKLYTGKGVRGVEQQLGNLPMTAAVAANLMVAAAMPILLGSPEPIAQHVRFFDLLEDDWESIEM